MAFEYQSYASLGLNLNRQKYGPLDVSNVFTSENDLKYYLSKGVHTEGVSEYWTKITPYPYEGQVLATVIDGVVEVFVLALNAEGNFETREIAGKIEVDGKTIVKDAEGKLSIVAPVDTDSNKTYNFAYANGVYSWVEVDTTTASGQAQEIASLTERTVALEEAINGKGDGEAHIDGLAAKVAINIQAIAAEESRAAAAEAKVLSDAKTYTDEEIIGLDITIDDNNNIVITNKAGAEVASVNAAKFVKDGMLDHVVYDDDAKKLIITWNTDAGKSETELEIGDLVDTYTAGNGIKVENNEISIDEAKVATVSALDNLSSVVETKQTAEQVANAIDAKLEPYAKTSDVVSNAYFAEHVDAYTQDKETFATKTELADKVNISDYNAAIASLAVKSEVENRIAGVETAVTANYYNKADTDEKFATIANAATKEDLAAIDGKADSNTNLITNLTGRLDGIVAQGGEPNVINNISINGVIQEIKDKVVDISVPVIANTAIADLKDGEGIIDAVNANTAAIAALQSKDNDLTAAIATKADASSVYTKDEANAAIKAAVDAVNLTPYAKSEDVTKEIGRIDEAIATKAVAADVYTKKDADDKFQTEAQVDARINALIVSADPEGGKTIENIQNLVKYVDENAGTITALVTSVTTNTKNISKNTEDIASLQNSVDELSTSEVNVNRLIQTEGDVLILNGGNA